MSGGTRQKLNLALAVLADPELLLLAELGRADRVVELPAHPVRSSCS